MEILHVASFSNPFKKFEWVWEQGYGDTRRHEMSTQYLVSFPGPSKFFIPTVLFVCRGEPWNMAIYYQTTNVSNHCTNMYRSPTYM